MQNGEPVVVMGSEVTGNFFDVLGVPPAEGRVFDDSHTWAGSEPAVVLSHGFWSRQFGSDRSRSWGLPRKLGVWKDKWMGSADSSKT